MMITAQDVEDRLNKAREDYFAAERAFSRAATGGKRLIGAFQQAREASLVVCSWERVSARVRAGEDVLIAVMSRE